MKTLHRYLTLDLVKVTAMSTAAFTLVMTVIGILEPLRKQGLAAREVVSVLGLTFLLMLSLALPIATLFAATIIYGRFSQDNELTACRASGVSTIGVLKPVLWVGCTVTLMSLLLSNVIVPHMAKGVGIAIYQNMQGVFFNVLSRRGTFDDFEEVVIRAEEADISKNRLVGLVVIRKRTDRDLSRDDAGNLVPEQIPFMVAEEARVVGFAQTPDGDTWVRVHLIEARGELREQLGIQESGIVEWGPLPNPIEESSSLWSDWGTLLGALRDPTQHPEIGKALREHRRDIGNEMFAQEIIATINADRAYRGLRSETHQYEIHAAGAYSDGPSAIVLENDIAPDGTEVPVEVREVSDDGHTIVRTASHGEIEMGWSAFRNIAMVTIRLSPPVRVVDSSDPTGQPRREDAWVKGGDLSLPRRISRRQEEISLITLLDHPSEFTSNRKIIEHIRFLRETRVPKLNNDNIALMHFRVSYGASCFLMVAMGAALGLLFRGGQVLVAFVLALIPAAVVLLMGMMGKEMVRNPDVPRMVGLMCIWGGVAMILAANLGIYWHLSKK